MKLVVAAVRPTPILWRRASGLESPTEVPASTLPARGIAPVRANIASRSVVLPLWKGPTSAMHRGPRGLLTSCPIAVSSSGARPLIGSAAGCSAYIGVLASRKNIPLQHDPEKWVPFFRKRSYLNKKIERDGNSTKSHLALNVRCAAAIKPPADRS